MCSKNDIVNVLNKLMFLDLVKELFTVTKRLLFIF